MKLLQIFAIKLICILLVCCQSGIDKSECNCQKHALKLSKEDFSLFENIMIVPRGNSMAPFAHYILALDDGNSLTLPVYDYYGCSIADIECLKYYNGLPKDLEIYCKEVFSGNEKDCYIFQAMQARVISKRFDELDCRLVNGKKYFLGELLVFLFDGDCFVAHAPDLQLVKNEFWKKRLQSAQELKDVGVYFGKLTRDIKSND